MIVHRIPEDRISTPEDVGDQEVEIVNSKIWYLQERVYSTRMELVSIIWKIVQNKDKSKIPKVVQNKDK